jgi:hypothetical protein
MLRILFTTERPTNHEAKRITDSESNQKTKTDELYPTPFNKTQSKRIPMLGLAKRTVKQDPLVNRHLSYQSI